MSPRRRRCREMCWEIFYEACLKTTQQARYQVSEGRERRRQNNNTCVYNDSIKRDKKCLHTPLYAFAIKNYFI